MTVAIPSPSGERLVPAFVRGRRIVVECPTEWCTVDHAARDEDFLEDVSHMTDTVSVSAPVGLNHRRENVLEGFITESPFRGQHAMFAFDAMGTGEFAMLSKVQALAFADQLVAHAAQIRALAATIAD